MRRSIRWSLLLGLAALLAGVIGAFGGFLYLRIRDTTLHAVDADLSAHAKEVAGSMREVSDNRFEVTYSDAQSHYFKVAGILVIRDRQGRVVDFVDPRFEKRLEHPSTRSVTVAGPG